MYQACLKNSEEDSGDGAEHPQGRAGGGESKGAGRSLGINGLADHAKDFGFYSKCDGKPLEGFNGKVI